MAFDESLSDERTEQPTAKRREEAQREGRVAISQDLTGAVVVLGGLGGCVLAGPAFVTAAIGLFQEGLRLQPQELTIDGTLALLAASAANAAHLGWPLVAAPLFAGIAATLLQTRFALAPRGPALHWNRLSLGQGFNRLLGGQGAMNALKATLKLSVVGTVSLLTLQSELPHRLTAPSGIQAATMEAVGGVVSRV